MNNKIYIAGKITGDPDYKVKFKAAEADIIHAQRECVIGTPCGNCLFKDLRFITPCRIYEVFPDSLRVVNPIDFGLDKKPYWIAMLVCLARLSKCSHVYFLRDWKQSKGARKELWLATLLHKKIIYQK